MGKPAEILAIGDEITSGQLLDTNTQWLSLRLEELGLRVLYHATVGDELEPIAAAFRQAIARSRLVLVTGGLGPTADDLTRDALALATGRSLVLDAEALEYIRGLFARRNRPMPEQNERQALFPAGSRVVPNPHGTAPGIDLEVSGPAGVCRIIVLPGVPAEMKEMWHGTVARSLADLGEGKTVRHRRIKCFGAGESQVEAMLPDLIRRGREPRVGITAVQTSIVLRITAEGSNDSECLAAMVPTAEIIYQCLGDLIYGEADDELQDVVLRRLRNEGKTLAVGEWGTGGMLADWLAAAPDGRGAFLGGLLVGSPAAFERLCGSEDHRDKPGARLAAKARDQFSADYALGVGPFMENEKQTVEIAVAGPSGTIVKEVPFSFHPAVRRVYCAKHAINLLRLG